MKNIYLTLFFLALVFTACEKNSDSTEMETTNPSSEPIETINFKWRVSVQEEESLQKWNYINNNSLQNVSVNLMFGGESLWEGNTDRTGGISFPEQVIPAVGAFFQFESPGYYPLIVQVEGETIPLWRVNMIRNTYPDINGEAILNAESYITLTGDLQDPSTARESWYYITNSDNELIGNSLVDPELPSFYMTTLPNEELFLHYNVECGGDGVVALGPFTESTDIGALVDQSFDFSFDYDLVYLDNVTECDTETKLYGYELFYKIENLTYQATGNSGFNIPDCQSTAYPILLSVATQNPRKYVELTITHSPGQQSDVPDQQVCDVDDTFLKYTIGGGLTGGGDVFTYANILPDGQMVLKQAEHPLTEEHRFTILLDGSAVGSHACNINTVIRNVNSSGGWSQVNGLGGYQLSATVTMNDGVFVEGTVSGEVLDSEEVSLGIILGTFRARIQ